MNPAAESRSVIAEPGIERLALIVVVVAVLDGFSLFLANHAVHVDMLWPARGVVLAFCLLGHHKSARPVLFAALLGGVLGELAVGETLVRALLQTSFSVTGIAITYFFVARSIGPEIDFRSWRQLSKFVTIGWVTAAATSLPGSWYLSWQEGTTFLQVWIGWSLSTILSYAIFTPTLVLLSTMRNVAQPPMAERRILVANLAMLVVLMFVFSQSTYPAGFMVAVCLLGVAFFAGTEGAAIGLLLTAVVSLAATAMGRGPWLLMGGSLSLRIDAIQIFLSVLTIGIIPTAAAITERRRLQESLSVALDETRRTASALRESEALYRLLAENASDIVIRTDVTGRILYVAPSIERILGYRASHLIGTTIYDVLLTEDVSVVKGAVSDALRGQSVSGHRIEYRARHGNGRVVWLESCPTVGRDVSGLEGIVDIARDITERKAMERELIEARERAEAAAEAKSAFLANVSHELKTPLTSVIGFADALNDYCQLDDRAARFADRVRTASLALLSTVNDILDYSRVEQGQLSFEPQLFPLRRHIEDALDLFAVQAAEKGLELRLECASSLDATEVLTDPHRLRQVLLNLVGNAVKFTNAGSVTVVVSCARSVSKGNYLRCEIVDTGPGIDSAHTERLFHRFSQIDNSNTRRFGGTGLGLAICKAIVSTMDGDIGVSTQAGRGARFWFEIPVQITGTKELLAAS